MQGAIYGVGLQVQGGVEGVHLFYYLHFCPVVFYIKGVDGTSGHKNGVDACGWNGNSVRNHYFFETLRTPLLQPCHTPLAVARA